MSKTLTEIAEQLKAYKKKVQLIYAFNGSGKTRLSREFKALMASEVNEEGAEGEEALELAQKNILYYNAFTEDLFYWDNDLETDEAQKLKIHPNTFTRWVLEEQGQDQNIVSHFQRLTRSKLTPKFSADFSAISFSMAGGDEDGLENLKISKGEESNFIWSVFYSLLDQVVDVLNTSDVKNRETKVFDQLKHVFIDDPVSSLDDNHLIQLACDLAELIKTSDFTDGRGLQFIITTHNPLFHNVLLNELGLKNKKDGCYLLEPFEDGTFKLNIKPGDSNKSFSYHLHLKQVIEYAIEHNQIERYHFTLLRNLYEKTASFLGYPKWSELLPDDQENYSKRIMNFTSHSTLSNEQVADPTEPEKQIVKFLLNNLVNNYAYWQQEEQHD